MVCTFYAANDVTQAVSGCNVGYAFVNFITVDDLLRFAKSRLGVKWCVSCLTLDESVANFPQEYVCQRKGFANVLCQLSVRPCPLPYPRALKSPSRGKEALIEKFKNSAIMDEREAWRPKIFYSNGPQVGQAEPFPAPTHQRRKERSAHNRGALYVPGAARLHSSGRVEEYDRGERHIR